MRGDAPLDGYHRRAVPAPDPELTQVGPGTPCGEYLRRFWQPVAFARDLTTAPVRARILGEDLVVFRDRGGRAGVLHLHCAHRGTSLEFGIPVERGLRCCVRAHADAGRAVRAAVQLVPGEGQQHGSGAHRRSCTR